MKFENIGNQVEIIECIDKCFFTGEQVSFGVIRESEGDGRVFCPNNSVVLNVKQVGEVLTRLENNSEEKMMKTVWDAVNELKGELTGCCEYLVTTGRHWSGPADMNECIEVGAFRHIMGDDAWVVLCTTREFNECVAEMSDWRPPMTEEVIQAMAQFNEEVKSMTDADKELKPYVRRTSKPIFTQAMADTGELPPVGSEVVLNCGFNGHNKGDILKVYSHDVSSNYNCVLAGAVIKDVSGGVQAFEYHSKLLSPICPPIVLEDGEWYMCEVLGGDRFIKTCLFRSGSKWVDSEVGSVGITAKPLYKMVKA